MTASLQSEIETAVGLCTKDLSERFDILLQADCQPSSKAPATGHGPKEVVRDMLMFNVDAWPTRSADLVDYGSLLAPTPYPRDKTPEKFPTPGPTLSRGVARGGR